METERVCEVLRLGQVSYESAWQLQDQLAGQLARGERAPALLLLEHPHTFTIGRRGQDENLLWTEEERAQRGVSVYHVDRGGDITYHGPGQLVGYPILALAPRGWQGERLPQADFVGYIRRLEKMLIGALARLGLAAGQVPGQTGVWIQPEVYARCLRCDPALKGRPAKIASIGVKVDANGISRHGFALNVNPDPTYWSGIIPCGIKDVAMVSLADFIQPTPEMAAVMDAVAASFGDVFELRMREAPAEIV